MTIDITKCNKINVTDSCALWNVLSSPTLYGVLVEQQFIFSCTDFVVYECLYRSRTTSEPGDAYLKGLAKTLIGQRKIESHPLTIEDLQDEKILQFRNQIGRGELSSIAFAKKTGLSLLTDDQKARRLGGEILGANRIQTTPLLFGWLMFNNYLSDQDLEPVIADHKQNGRPLEKYFRAVHEESWRIKLMIKN